MHAENGDAIQFAQEALIAQGITGPEGHSMSRPAYIEVCLMLLGCIIAWNVQQGCLLTFFYNTSR